ncbi:MAG: energy transducer TonB, partial [Vicinamibacterales bacterium]
VDRTGTVAEARVIGIELEVNDAQGGRLAAAIRGDTEFSNRMEQFLARSGVRLDSSQPWVAWSTLRPVIDAFMHSAVTSVLQSRYEPPVEGPLAFDLTIHFAGNPTSTAQRVSPDSPLADGAIRVGGGIAAPRKIRDARPVYPPEAQEAGVEGVVVAEIRIDPNGRVAGSRLLRSVAMLDQAALDAIHQWEFEPTLLNGQPTPVAMTVTVQFTLRQ